MEGSTFPYITLEITTNKSLVLKELKIPTHPTTVGPETTSVKDIDDINNYRSGKTLVMEAQKDEQKTNIMQFTCTFSRPVCDIWLFAAKECGSLILIMYMHVYITVSHRALCSVNHDMSIHVYTYIIKLINDDYYVMCLYTKSSTHKIRLARETMC